MPPDPHVPPSTRTATATPPADPPAADRLELARHSAEAHATFQRLMTEAHLEYLRVIEALVGHRPAPAGPPPAAVPPTAPAAVPPTVPAQSDRHTTPPDPVPPVAPPAFPAAGPSSAAPVEPTAGPRSTEIPPLADLRRPTAPTAPTSPAGVTRPSVVDRTIAPTTPARPAVEQPGVPTPADPGAAAPGALTTTTTDAGNDRSLLPADQEARGPGPDDDSEVARLTMAWSQTPLGGLAPPGLHTGPIHVVDGGSGLGAAVAAELSARGLAAEVATRPGLGGVVFLGGLARPASPDEAMETQLSALWLAGGGKDRGVFVTVADTMTGRAGAWLGGLAGLVAAVGRERPATSAIAIECERGDRDPEEVAALVADELTRGAGAQRVRIAADGTRSVGRLVSAGAGAARERVIGPESVIVASGEAGGLCGATLVALARSARCRLVLLGRTPLVEEPEHLAGARDEVSLMRTFAAGTGGPDGLAGMRSRARAVLAAREIRRTVAACTAAGAETRYLHVDDADADGLAGRLDQVRADWGPITGVLHCAEVVTDRRPGERSAVDADRALSTHLAGLPALLAATVPDQLETLLLFSSAGDRDGDLGTGTRSLVAATLDRIAEAELRRRPGCLVRSLSWDPSTGDMAGAAEVRARAAAFVAELALDGPAHVVLAPRSTAPEQARPAGVVVSPGTHPWLADHRPQNVAVLPLAAGLGWMAGAVRVREQDAVLTGVRVLRSVSTEHPQQIGVTVFGREVWLSNDAGEPCFRAGFGRPGPDREWHPAGDPARFPGASVYGGRPLFHGPRLQVVRSLGEIGPDGVVGTVLGARAMGWPADDLPVDVAALDGALQLSGVWAMDEHRPVLPLGVAECRIHRWGRLPGPALCVVAGGRRDDDGARCDAALVGPDGELWAELLGIEFLVP